MKREFKKQVFIGISGTVGMGLIAAAFIIWGLGINEWVRYAALAVLMAGFIGCFLYIFSGRKGFFSGAKYGLGFVLLTVAAKELPVWIFGITIVAAVIVFFALPLIKQYNIDREKSSDKVIEKRTTENISLEETTEEMLQDEAELKQSIGLGEKSLLILAGTGGMYQLIRGSDRLFFVRVGGEVSGLDTELLRTDFTDESSLIRNKKDFLITLNNISEIKCRYGKHINGPIEYCGKLTVTTYSKKYSFAILDSVSEKKLEVFFKDIPFSFIGKPKKQDACIRKLTEEERRALPVLKKTCLVLTVLSVVFGAAFIFLAADPIVYRIFSAICMLIPAVTLVLYVKYNNVLSAEDNREPIFQKTRINVNMPILIPSAALGIRSFYDFNVLGWEGLLVWSAAIIAVALLVLFKFTKEYKRKKSVIFTIILSILFYAPSIVMQVNCLYDYSKPVISESVVLDKHISKSRHSTLYYFDVYLGNGDEKKLKVSRNFYEQRDKGAIVMVLENQGLLGIDYVYIDEDI